MTDEKLTTSGERKMKHPWLAVLLSKMFPGAGQIYGGAKARGIFFIAFAISLLLIMVLSTCGFLFIESATASRTLAAAAFAAGIVVIVLNIYVLFDAYKIAKRYNAEHAHADAVAGRRKPWLAAFLSSLFPSIGQFYNRQVLKGIAFIAVTVVAFILQAVFAPLFIFVLLVYLIGIKDAFDSAEALNGSGDRFFRQERAIVLLIVVILSLQAIPFAEIIKDHVIKAFKMPSGSMYPTLKIGDHFLIGKTKSFRVSLKRGDVVVFPYPVNPEKNFVKRVIGLGGDKVQIINGELYINEQLVQLKKQGVQEEDDHLWLNTIGPPTVYEERIGDATYRVQYLRDKSTTNGGPWLVPQDAVFVMGDNRDNSQDSRVWGPVPRNSIEGKALKIYWSWNREELKVRWDRIGETLH